MRADDDAREDVAEHHRLLEPMEEHRHHTRDHHDHCQILEKLMACMACGSLGWAFEG